MIKLFKNLAQFGLLMSISALSFGDCGDAPQAPELVDGSTASMEELVANSKEVNAFIETADSFLDCNDTFGDSDEFKAMSKEARKAYVQANRAVLGARNDIGDKFNAQIQAYKAANPDS